MPWKLEACPSRGNVYERSDIILRNLSDVRERIARAAGKTGRDAHDITLVAVTKAVGVREVEALIDLGVCHFGENRVPGALTKIQAIAAPVTWHFIGKVQRRKARDVVRHFDTIDSVDHLDVAEAIEHRAQESEKRLPVLVEVNVSGEESKHGIRPDELGCLLDATSHFANVRVDGLMTMAPLTDDEARVRGVFAGLRGLAEQHGLRELSMGMSNDFEWAIEEGATQIRIGSRLFDG